MKILATVDGSDLSHAILTVLGSLAEDMKAEIRLLTVMDPPTASTTGGRGVGGSGPAAIGTESIGLEATIRPTGAGPSETQGQALDRAHTEGSDYLETIVTQLRDSGFSVSTEVVIDANAAEAIVDTARREGVDMIAMATHGRSGLSRLRHGSVADSVLTAGVSPVLLVRPAGPG